MHHACSSAMRPVISAAGALLLAHVVGSGQCQRRAQAEAGHRTRIGQGLVLHAGGHVRAIGRRGGETPVTVHVGASAHARVHAAQVAA